MHLVCAILRGKMFGSSSQCLDNISHLGYNVTITWKHVMLMLGVSEKPRNITLLRQLLSGFCDIIVLLIVCYNICRRSRNIILECYLDPVLTAVYV